MYKKANKYLLASCMCIKKKCDEEARTKAAKPSLITGAVGLIKMDVAVTEN